MQPPNIFLITIDNSCALTRPMLRLRTNSDSGSPIRSRKKESGSRRTSEVPITNSSPQHFDWGFYRARTEPATSACPGANHTPLANCWRLVVITPPLYRRSHSRIVKSGARARSAASSSTITFPSTRRRSHDGRRLERRGLQVEQRADRVSASIRMVAPSSGRTLRSHDPYDLLRLTPTLTKIDSTTEKVLTRILL